MIGHLKGVVESITGPVAVIDVNGVGYEVHCSLASLATLSIGSPATIVIYTDVRQDEIRLYGFCDFLEKRIFLLLTTVQGVGPKSALEIISRLESRELLRAIGQGNAALLQAMKGIGKKTSERIIVELKDKVAELADERHASGLKFEKFVGEESFEEAIQALEALGIPRKEAELAVQTAQKQGDLEDADSGQIVKQALQFV